MDIEVLALIERLKDYAVVFRDTIPKDATDYFREASLQRHADLTAAIKLIQATPEKWTCFHCGFSTSDESLARAHFSDYGEGDPALCVTPWDENSILAEWQEMIRQRNEAERLQDERIKALEAINAEMEEIRKTQAEHIRCITTLRLLAHNRGWNGVENSKVLEMFWQQYVEGLEAETAKLKKQLRTVKGGATPLLRDFIGQRRQIEFLKKGIRNVAGDELCWITDADAQIPPKEEFLASCERYHAQLSGERGELKDCRTIAELERALLEAREEIERLRGNPLA